LWRELLGAVPALEDGALPLPDGPGFGVALNGEAVARRPYQPRPGWR
jgi:L-alanine-DL-glutamate epimerase-like enolase superfamily enzyme